jgi:hypothetical protein
MNPPSPEAIPHHGLQRTRRPTQNLKRLRPKNQRFDSLARTDWRMVRNDDSLWYFGLTAMLLETAVRSFANAAFACGKEQ